jgi:hypothetical protein
MENIIGRCGYRCDLCLAYKSNNKSQNDQQRFKDGLFRVYKYTMALKKCYCEGCLANDDENPVQNSLNIKKLLKNLRSRFRKKIIIVLLSLTKVEKSLIKSGKKRDWNDSIVSF